MLDPTRPCNSKNRKPNRYTKDELITMASKLPSPPKNLKKMTIDALCTLLHSAEKPDAVVSKKKTSGCRLDLSRPCQSKSRKPTRYTKPELTNLWKTQCSSLSGAKPTTIDSFCTEIRKIQSLEKKKAGIKIARFLHKKRKSKPTFDAQPLDQLKDDARLKIAKFMKRVAMKKKASSALLNPSMFLNLRYFNVSLPEVMRIPKKVSKNLLDKIRQIETDNIFYGNKIIEMKAGCDREEIPHPEDLSADNPNLLINRNLSIPDFRVKYEEWEASQREYIKSLSWVQKLLILGYTYGGDKMLNNLILKDRCDSWDIIPDDFDVSTHEPYCMYLSRVIYPLAIFLHLDVQSTPDPVSFVESYEWMGDYIKELLMGFYPQIKNKTFHQNYEKIFKFFVEQRNRFPSVVLENYIRRFQTELENIIRKAPKTPFQFWVYRGISKKDYVVIGSEKRHVFQNNAFMSSSINICRTILFTDEACCVQQILVPKGVQCLLISLFSSFPDENEVLFAPKCWLYPLGKDYISLNGKMDTRKFLIAS